MHRTIGSFLVAGLLMVSPSGSLLAQDEDLRMGHDPAYFQRVELPEAGLSVSVPDDWEVDAEAYFEPDEDGDDSKGYWIVFAGHDTGGGWCRITKHVHPGTDLRGLAERMAGRYDEGPDGESTADGYEVELSIGEAYRIDVRYLEDDDHSSFYLFDSDDFRYTLTCYGGERDPRDWMDIAETLEWLPADPEAEPTPEPQVVFRAPTYELTLVDLDQANMFVLLPTGWDIDIRMEQEEFDLPPEYADAAPVYSTSIVYAESDTGDWCSLKSHEGNPLSLEEHAAWREVTYVQGAPPSMIVERSLITLHEQPAYRVDLTSDEHVGAASAFVFEIAGVRYGLTCGSDLGASPTWETMAASVIPLADTPSDGPESEPEPEPSIEPVIDSEALELDRVEVPEVGVAMLLPQDWEFELRMEAQGFGLPDAYSDAVPLTYVTAFVVESEAGDSCLLNVHEGNPMMLEEHSEWDEQSLAAVFPQSSVERRPRDLWTEPGYVIEIRSPAEGVHANVYLFEADEERYEVRCSGESGASGAWDTIAGSLEALGGDPGPDLERHELAEAGVAIELPPDWVVETGQVELRAPLPPEYGESVTVPLTQFLWAYRVDGTWCSVYRFDETPLSLSEHGAWVEARAEADPDDPAMAEVTPVTLAVGEAVQIIKDYESSTDAATYLFDLGGYRYHVGCGGESVPDDAWLSVVQTVEPLWVGPTEDVPEGVPEEAEAWSEVGPFGSLLNVSESAVMRATCERALWVELADGTFEERIDCVLAEDPVDPPDVQGVVPNERVTFEGGSCEWVSDFWLASDGSNVWAESWSVAIEPDGSVAGSSTYGAELLECPES